jgi:Xaa-Pro aminopeptidase
MEARIKQLRQLFAKHDIDAFIVMNETNIKYLTRFPASESWLFITKTKVYYVTDFRYILEAKAGLKGIEVVRYTKSFYETVFQLAAKNKIKKCGFDAYHLSLGQYHHLKKFAKNIQLIERNGLVEHLREVKDQDEIKAIREALKVHSDALKLAPKWVRPGRKETDVLADLQDFAKSKKVGFSFPPIIASGPNSCFPHARASERKIKNNEPVLFDMGIDKNGYKSDLTRMFFLGRIPKLVTEINDYVRVAQQKAIKIIKPGICIAEVDKAARGFLASKGLDQYFGHALGHGVGLDIHESPRLSSQNTSVLKPGMVITVEPAVYLPNKFGIRLEEMVLVTKTGCEVLSGYIN